ncbi:MAG: DnaA/Hda family protein [Candidatus Competibacteraceae bacterium]|nr:DnaA/Hda family protein [Candidatus Competibacteraceae bacterium]
MQPQQIPLTLGPRDRACFAAFHPGPNRQALACLEHYVTVLGLPGVYLYGAADTGKSHLLAAACQAAAERGLAAVYLPLGEGLPHRALEGLESLALICLDDLQAIAGHRAWERALLELLERLPLEGTGLVMAGLTVPARMEIGEELRARLAQTVMVGLQPVDEAGRLAVLRHRARRRSLMLPSEVERYLARRFASLSRLMAALGVLERATLAAQRRPTLPFIRTVLQEAGMEGEG